MAIIVADAIHLVSDALVNASRYFRTDLTAGAALPVAAGGAGAAHPATDHCPAAPIAATFAVEAGLVFLATIVVCRVTILAANTFGGTAELRARQWLKTHCIRQRETVLAAHARPLGMAWLASAALSLASRASAALLAAAALRPGRFAFGCCFLPVEGEPRQERQTTSERHASRSERTSQCVKFAVVHQRLHHRVCHGILS
jgi:hypothetical protein